MHSSPPFSVARGYCFTEKVEYCVQWLFEWSLGCCGIAVHSLGELAGACRVGGGFASTLAEWLVGSWLGFSLLVAAALFHLTSMPGRWI